MPATLENGRVTRLGAGGQPNPPAPPQSRPTAHFRAPTNATLFERYGSRTWTRTYTCANFVQEILFREYGCDIPLPRNATQDAILDWPYDGYIEPLPDGAPPYSGCLALMHEQGAVRGVRFHLGVVTEDNHIFHLSRKAGPSMITIDSLPARAAS